ncbi:MAG: phosphoenolpyruvate--protein phosphotransferase [Bacteroidetes bacterium]|nr:phosphoenolpyruvate--protein phosphotransferase [Bacteroidota bacterium]
MKTESEIMLKGIAAAPGIAISKAYIYARQKEEVADSAVTDLDEALEMLDTALEQSRKELRKIFSLAVDKLGEKRAAIFEAQIMILDDPILLSTIKNRITNERRAPEYIVNDEISKYTDLMNASHELYMKERSHDIEDIKNRILRNLKKKKWKSRIANDVIVVTSTITPSDTVLFSRVNAKGYVTDFGGLTSHAAIVARSLNIPAVVGLHEATSRIKDDDLIIIDGFKGEIFINPDEKLLKEYQKKIVKLAQRDSDLLKLKDLPAVTSDGKEIQLLSNLDILDEMEIVTQHCARGIGLVRTEGLFEEYEAFPDEEEQFKVYKEISERMFPGTVIIRAFDIGGDKVLPVDLHEPNPFLGWRGIRLLLDNPSLFKKQIRAILRASTHKNIKFMLPMIASLAEIRRTKEIVKECQEELKKEGTAFDKHLSLGVMIEIPSAAVLIKDFAKEVDFVSIGTNDLIQYLLAVDRGNEIVSALYQEFHPAVVQTINHIIQGGKESKILVSMCGAMAADPFAVPLLIGLGLESLSVSASAVPLIKRIIRNIDCKEVQGLAKECLALSTEKEINDRIHKYFNHKLQDQIKNLY